MVVPGGFSYGDYLRAGAIARFSPLMESVVEFARDGGPVLGICNGFQVLCEAGLLPGALLPNDSLRFVCRQVEVDGREPGHALHARVRRGRRALDPRQAHRPAATTRRPATLAEAEPGGAPLRGRPQPERVDATTSPACATRTANVMGLMPHPEHAVDPLTGSADGGRLFESLAHWSPA